MPEIIRSAFNGPGDEFNGSGKRPVVFDIIDADRETSLLPDDLKLVLHVNPSSMTWNYGKSIERTQTLGGYVEAHWGPTPTEVSFEAVTGGFVRLYTGVSAVTGPTPSSTDAVDLGGTRRDTIAYDKFVDLLAFYHDNGAIYDTQGNIAYQGQILMAYDGGSWWGWFTTFSVTESADKPYMFNYSIAFTVDRELHRVRGTPVPFPQSPSDGSTPPAITAGPVQSPVATPDPLTDEGWDAAVDRDLFGSALTEQQIANGTTPPQVGPTTPTPRRRNR